MNLPDNFELERYKKPLIFALFFLIWAGSFYFLVLSKIFSVNSIKERITADNSSLTKYEKGLKTMKNNRKILEKRYEDKVIFTEKLMAQKKKTDFDTSEAFERYISEELSTHLLTLKTIARTESVKDSNKRYFPYRIEGKERNLLDFIAALENGEKKISFADTPFSIKLSDIAVFDGKIAADILNINPEMEITDERIPLHIVTGKKVTRITTLNLGENNYLLIYFNDGTKKISHENEVIEIEDKKYTLRFKNGEIYLEK